ncbi:MAG: hypothetical protein ABIP89_23240 [Polyangiaceae bacterium]
MKPARNAVDQASTIPTVRPPARDRPSGVRVTPSSGVSRPNVRSTPTSHPPLSVGPLRPIRDLLACFELGDYLGALALADAVLDPGATPVLTLPREDSPAHGLDAKTALVFSLVDGQRTLEDVLEVSELPMLDALRVVCELVEEGHIFFIEQAL